MRRKLKYLILVALFVKMLVIYFTPVARDQFNPDEERNFEIALNNIAGHGYTIYDMGKSEYKSTAFHNSAPVFVYEFLIRNGISRQAWIWFFYIVSTIFFFYSIIAFFKCALFILKNSNYAFYCTIVYCFYPSVIYFIGALFYYENVVMYILIILMARLLLRMKNRKIEPSDYYFFPFFITISALLRPHTIPIYFFVFAITFFLIVKNKIETRDFIKKFFLVGLLSIILFLIANVPILIKNKKMFGEYVLSTQFGYEILQGHNALAKGSWYGKWWDSTGIYYKYVHANIKGIDTLNEYEESQERKKLAFNWIKSNPMGELKLIIRKTVIYFWPKNYDVLWGYKWINPVNIFIHLLFLFFILSRIRTRKCSAPELILLSVSLVPLIISLVFFVIYRTRIYAEPFMIILAFKFLLDSVKKNRLKQKLPV